MVMKSNVIFRTMIALYAYVITGKKYEISDDIDFAALYEMSSKQGIANVIYVALLEQDMNVPADIMRKFKNSHDQGIYAETVQAIALDEITKAFEDNGIDHIPLKGSVLKYMYKSPDYRQSGDIDILIHSEDEDRATEIMQNIGYTQVGKYTNHDVHRVYKKPPLIIVEMHKALTRNTDRMADFCSRAWEYSCKEEGYEHLYRFENEYLYTYILGHICKHIYYGGIGVRAITDLFVIKQSLRLNIETLNKMLEEARLKDLDNMLDKLLERWFADNRIPDRETELLEEMIILSGCHGNEEMRSYIWNSETFFEKTKRRISRLFPNKGIMVKQYPVIDKCTLIMPFFWVIRIFRILLVEKDRVKAEIADANDGSKNIKELRRILDAVR